MKNYKLETWTNIFINNMNKRITEISTLLHQAVPILFVKKQTELWQTSKKSMYQLFMYQLLIAEIYTKQGKLLGVISLYPLL